MLKSMTGFGKATTNYKGRTIVCEIKSLNSKSADINLRLASAYRAKELEIKTELIKQLDRGKIDLSIYIDISENDSELEINLALAKAYKTKIVEIANAINEPHNDILKHILKMPDVFKAEKKEVDTDEWAIVMDCFKTALQQINEFRIQEGKSLIADFNTRLNNIEKSLQLILGLDENRIKHIKERINKNLEELVGKDKIDNNRLEQELIYYVEKLDINEEKVRLSTHLDYFKTTMLEQNCGKKLGFITQEIGREINTIGSKANNAEIQKLVVMMKDELEKMKEQCNNVL